MLTLGGHLGGKNDKRNRAAERKISNGLSEHDGGYGLQRYMVGCNPRNSVDFGRPVPSVDHRKSLGNYMTTWTEIIALGIGGIILLALLVIVGALIGGSIALWALNILGFLEPFTWEKAIALGILIGVITGGITRKGN